MVTEGARRSPRLGRKPLGHVGRHLTPGAAAEKRSLQDKADHDHCEVVAEHIPEGHRIPNNPGMIIAQRRPIRSPAQSQSPLDRKTTMFAKMIGVAIIAGLSP